MKKIELEIYKSYHIPGCQNFYRRPKNALYLSSSNSYEHEFAKFQIAMAIKMKGHDFICEACPNDRPNRKIDVIDITEGIEYEAENSGEFKTDGTKNFKVITQDEYEKLKRKVSSKGSSSP